MNDDGGLSKYPFIAEAEVRRLGHRCSYEARLRCQYLLKRYDGHVANEAQIRMPPGILENDVKCLRAGETG